MEADTDLNDEPDKTTDNNTESDIMTTKSKEVMRNHPNISNEVVVSLLSFSDAEREHVDSTTSKQCKEWYLHKAVFITDSKCTRVFAWQGILEKNKENVIKLVQDIALARTPRMHSQQQEMKPQNAREWG